MASSHTHMRRLSVAVQIYKINNMMRVIWVKMIKKIILLQGSGRGMVGER